ncbi:MAG: dockerin type I repeat-containing protein [Ruminococcus sp.]|uniref:dockerin type I repeat-containing protein n=1 Tax=Ruminococcus sp. TaxID=41978 RepID=UPI002873A30E|nr:dockerin type I repeat-containing protein [Ruminococcus sp.]MBQ3285943.1 dockerin type I repeat-containing protein [Ruminococcus sp.]
MANITRKYAISRLNVQPGEFYDRTDDSTGTQTILLDREIGCKNFYEEAIGFYSDSYGEVDPYTEDGCSFINQDRMKRWTKGYPSEAYVKTTLENAGLSTEQIESIISYIRTNFANTMSDGHTLKDFLINCGYNVDSEQNAEALYLIHKSREPEITGGDGTNTSATEKIDVYMLDGPRIPEVTIADYVTCAAVGDDGTVSPLDPVLYFRTADCDRGHLTEAIAMAESMVEDQQNGAVRYSAESFANLNEALEIAKDYENSTNQEEIIDQAYELINAIYDVHVLAPIGDADQDGFVTIMDATLIQKNLANMHNSELSEDQSYLADVDKNERIETIDATLIQRYLANMTSFWASPARNTIDHILY